MNSDLPFMEGLNCPIPIQHSEQIVLGHGSGGKMSLDLIKKYFLPPFSNPVLNAGDDAGVVDLPCDTFHQGSALRIAISTDSHVVWPLFFPGGDIGRLAICGTVNDVAMMGAQPLYISAGFIIEEGLDLMTLSRIIASMKEAATEAGVSIITGDTKVVQKGKADGVYINTTGIGIVPPGTEIGGNNARPGDLIILSGPIGEHGLAVIGARGDLGLLSTIKSDVAPLNHLVKAMLNTSNRIHVLRDPTRGGLATTLNEIAQQSCVCILINESHIPIKPETIATCDMLGFDPLHIANEGKLVVIIDRNDAQSVLSIMKQIRYGEEAVIIGEVLQEPKERVLMKTTIGTSRVVDIPAGELLPRIC